MTEKDTEAQATKQPGWFQGTTNRAIAALGVLTALAAALVGLLDGVDKLVAKAQQTIAVLSGQAPTGPPSAPSTPAPQQNPQPASPAREATLPGRVTERHIAGPLFVAAPPGSDGALIGARARRVLEQEGFALVGDRGAAGIAIEIAPPVFGPARTLPSSGLAITSVAATLQAAITSGTGGAPAAPPQQREVVGRGDGEEAARLDAVGRAADQLSERIAAALRQNAASNGPKP